MGDDLDMLESVKLATRESYGIALCELAKEHDNFVVLDADLAAATKTEMFKKEYPDRFFDCGISEANMIGVAAGIATTGLIPFATSFAMFSTGRAYEQIRNMVGYPHLSVKIVGTHAGITVGEDGATHQCLEDIALMRTIPGMTIINPSDHYETIAAVRAAYNHYGPVYIRLGRLAIDSFNNSDEYRFELGKGVTLSEGNDITIIATGLMVNESIKAVKMLQDRGIHARLINIHTIKPIDKDIIIKAAMETKWIFTVEEHNVIGGLGEAVAAVVAENYPVPVYRIGVNDRFGHSGPATELLKEYGLDSVGIVDTVLKMRSRTQPEKRNHQ